QLDRWRGGEHRRHCRKHRRRAARRTGDPGALAPRSGGRTETRGDGPKAARAASLIGISMFGFDSLFGQEMAVSALRRALESDRLAGTYLLSGADGTGKHTVAQALAQAAACTDPILSPFDACGECESCRRAQMGAQPDIITITPAGEQIQIGQLWDRH